ncbi:MAG TPA: hypothetical protein PLU88_13290 [Armatimonadota bacterium]|jgi:hypothetical protein|nr:hypothetical protein [Armatimonadota bacterium]HOP79174.1 hypothetical protein [Armatimonadota bacterium]HPP76091.1 hypothetical protein [Armatimonadota bacterium]
MEYVLNWLVLILALGAILLVAFLCYADITRRSDHSPESRAVTHVEYTAEPSTVAAASDGMYVELAYCRNDVVEHVQKVYPYEAGYVGTESYPAMGAGMPVRCLEVCWRNGDLVCCNLDWQTQVGLPDENGELIAIEIGQSVVIDDGAELHVGNDWVIRCTIHGRTEE